MFRLKHGLLLIVVAFLAACGSQAELPNALPDKLSSVGELNTAELEQAFDAQTLSAENYWNKDKFNKFVLEKKVEGYGPEHQKYPVAVVCKVPYKSNVLYIAGAKKLAENEKAYFYVPKKFVKCAAIEFEVFGTDGVHFQFKQGQYIASSGVKYGGKLYIWGKHLDYKASEFFHVKDGKKYGEARFTVINKYKNPEPKKLVVNVEKFYKDAYGKHVDVGSDVSVKLTLVCEGNKQNLVFGDNHIADAYKLLGKTCYIEEEFYDPDYKNVDLKGSYKNFVGYDVGSYGDFDGSCKEYSGRDYCKVEPIKIDQHATKLDLDLIDVVEAKYRPEPKKLVIKVSKYYNDGSQYVRPSADFSATLNLVCGDVTVSLGFDSEKTVDDASGLLGEKCYLKETFTDKKYQNVDIKVGYTNYSGSEKGTDLDAEGDCETKYDNTDYCEAKYIQIDEHATQLDLRIYDFVKEKYHPA